MSYHPSVTTQAFTMLDTIAGPEIANNGVEYAVTVKDASLDAGWITVTMENDKKAYSITLGIQNGVPMMFIYRPGYDDPLIVSVEEFGLRFESMTDDPTFQLQDKFMPLPAYAMHVAYSLDDETLLSDYDGIKVQA